METLSDKIRTNGTLFEEDVKEFIRELKKEIKDEGKNGFYRIKMEWILMRIDKLAGDKLT